MTDQQLMYPHRRGNIGVIEGCNFKCRYCENSFQKVLKRFAKHGEDITFTPHLHLNRLDKKPPKTEGKQFVTIGLTSDLSFAPHEAMLQIIEYCRKWQDRTTFLLQSKNPAFFLKYDFPTNVILGTTIESNMDSWYSTHNLTLYKSVVRYSDISQAPSPTKRLDAMLELMRWDTNPLMVTIEPIMDFCNDVLVTWMMGINEKGKLIAINVGYDSSPEKNRLPEPSLEKTQGLIEELKGITEVRTKLIRLAWWE